MVAAAVATVGLVAAVSSGVADTGVQGTVDSVLQLSLTRIAPDRVQATVDATVAPTRMSVQGHQLDSYNKPVTGARAVAHGTGVLTITYGPQSP